MSYINTEIWDVVKSRSDVENENDAKLKLAGVFEKAWSNGVEVATRISTELPGLTLHDERHFIALFKCASLLLPTNHDLNPLEVFIFGMSVLIHDIGHTSAVYVGGLKAIKSSVEYSDALALQAEPETENAQNYALFQALRRLHAEQAVEILKNDYSLNDSDPVYILEDKDLRDTYAHVIGKIAASHHWNRENILHELQDRLPAPANYPSYWEIRPKLIAILLRCSDAIQIDRSRAPLFSKAFHNPSGLSKLHWDAQNKILAAVISSKSDRTLEFCSRAPFGDNEIESWWVAYDLCKVANNELIGCSLLLRDLNYMSFTADRVQGATDPELLAKTIQVENWTPVNAEVKITDTRRIIELFGGQQLYSRSPVVPIREAIQNAADAIRAKQAHSNLVSEHSDKIKIEVQVDDQSVNIKIYDTGIGMSKRILTGPLIEFGKSLWSSDELQDEYPGLISKKINQSGRYGIGFFSYLMISNSVKVMSHSVDENSAYSLELTHGELRPILRTIDLKKLNGYSTSVEFVYSLDDYKKLLSVRLERHNSAVAITLKERIAMLCATLPFEVIVEENGNKTVAHRSDWNIQENNQWLSDLYLDYKTSNQSEDQREIVELTSDLLSEFVLLNDRKRIVGKAAVTVSNFSTGAYAIGGFCLGEPSSFNEGFLGVLPKEPIGPSRMDGKPSDVYPSIEEWASNQANLIGAKQLDVGYLLNAAVYIANFGGDPMPVASCVMDKTVVPLSDVVSEIKNGKPIYFPASFSREDTIELGQIVINLTDYSSIGVGQDDIKLSQRVVEAYGGGTGLKEYYLTGFIDGEIEPKANTLIGCIQRKLLEVNQGFSISYEENIALGEYIGPSSERDKLETGQQIIANCLIIKPN